MPPRTVFILVMLLLLVVATAHILAAERATQEPCERVGGRTGAPPSGQGILAYVVDA